MYILKNVYPKEAKQVLSSVITNQGVRSLEAFCSIGRRFLMVTLRISLLQLANQTALLHTILAMITLSDGVLESGIRRTTYCSSFGLVWYDQQPGRLIACFEQNCCLPASRSSGSTKITPTQFWATGKSSATISSRKCTSHCALSTRFDLQSRAQLGH